MARDAWVENVFLEADGTFDFFKGALSHRPTT